VDIGKDSAMKGTTLLSLVRQCNPMLTKKEAHALVLCGDVMCNGETLRDPRTIVPRSAEIIFRKKRHVSRGGEKLAEALSVFPISVKGRVFIDAGASTGGFTQVLLDSGASYVYAVDVGYNQLAYSLRTDSRISVHERTNIVHFRPTGLSPHAAVGDLSFRSILGVAGPLLELLEEQWAIFLCKPQFEWQDPPPEFSGVVADRRRESLILKKVCEDLLLEKAFVRGIHRSPITGTKGNREYFLLLEGDSCSLAGIKRDQTVKEMVDRAVYGETGIAEK